MNVVLVSECNKNALKQTRRILDQFAERRGTRTWQTAITQQGLSTLRKLLRQSARKNTAVACHWVRARNQTELLWVVGDAKRFNAQGAVATNTTRRNVIRAGDENDWHHLQEIYLLAAMAALLHDLGKSCHAFQLRLRNKLQGRNQYRHEWVSVRLFQCFLRGCSDDHDWLDRLIGADCSVDDWLKGLVTDAPDTEADKPFAQLPPIAEAVAWLVLTHHRLPVLPQKPESKKAFASKVDEHRLAALKNLNEQISAEWNERPSSIDPEDIKLYWQFKHGLPVTNHSWRKQAAKIASKLKALLDAKAMDSAQKRPTANPYTMHISRLSVMLADHHYSALEAPSERLKVESTSKLYANTDKAGELKQRLDEHLLGVAREVGLITHALPNFESHLPRLARCKSLRRRSTVARFNWQNRAVDTIASMRRRADDQGAFIVNMASTGCGKTLANARIMYALADPNLGMRCSFALGLRTLTLQTGQQFQKLLELSEDQLAIRVGGGASRDLFEYQQAWAERTGSESNVPLLEEGDDQGGVLFEGNTEHPVLKRALKDQQARALLAAPVLSCTVDHLVPATDGWRGGRQIAPMLRLMSSDLVIDELDDFDINDLPALTRLVHWCGMLGSRVLISSATLPPSIVEGIFLAYRAGRQIYQNNRGPSIGAPSNICCAWVDENTTTTADCADEQAFRSGHQDFVDRRQKHLAKASVRRMATTVTAQPKEPDGAFSIRQGFAQQILETALQLHGDNHSIDSKSDKAVSFGLVRMANIGPLVDVALALYQLIPPENVHIHLCVYHSQFPLLMRSTIERHLDNTLQRHQADRVFKLPLIRQKLDQHREHNHLFIVLGSPVTEVGRDHDYDWAVVEPSSMRSLIQLAGRVMRHRDVACTKPNIAVFEENIRALEQPGEAAFLRPGFETKCSSFRLQTHAVSELLSEEQLACIDARPRIQPVAEDNWRPHHSLVDLEHARLKKTMLPQAQDALDPTLSRRQRARLQPQAVYNAASCWAEPAAHLTAALPQQQPFRESTGPETELVILPNEDHPSGYMAYGLDTKKVRHIEPEPVPIEQGKILRIPDQETQGERIAPWITMDYLEELTALAQARDMELRACAMRFGRLQLRSTDDGWRFHPVLGFDLR